jgi:hypothetical protein
MNTPDLTNAPWRTSTRSSGNGGACVEVAPVDVSVAVRDSKDRSGPALLVHGAAWTSFIANAKHGSYDLA